jgi:hypothetical protein
VNDVFGPEAASVHWHAFRARDGCEMCFEANLLWARSRFNYLTTRHFQLNLHAIRHIWIGLSIRVTDSFVDSQNPSFKQIVKNYIARQSHHDIRCDRAVYAGEKGSIRGHEAVNQRLFQRLSKNFDSELFGCQIYARLPKQ